MKLWSRGLGRTEVDMDFRYYEVTRDKESGNVCIVGNMRSPVNWEFRIMLESEDLPGFMKMLFNWSMIGYVIKNIYKYIPYLLTRKKFKEEGDMEEKVMKAYETLVTARPGRRGRNKEKATEVS